MKNIETAKSYLRAHKLLGCCNAAAAHLSTTQHRAIARHRDQQALQNAHQEIKDAAENLERQRGYSDDGAERHRKPAQAVEPVERHEHRSRQTPGPTTRRTRTHRRATHATAWLGWRRIMRAFVLPVVAVERRDRAEPRQRRKTAS